MTEREFVDRFTRCVGELAEGGCLPFNQQPSDYAATVGPIYWQERFPDGLGPEECAEEDATYWSDSAN